MPKKRPVPPDQGASTIMEEAGARLRLIRELGDQTQVEVCDLLGVDQSTWSKWESGKRVPDPLAVIRFAGRFRVSLDFIYTGRPIGVHPALLQMVRARAPALVRELPTDSPVDMDRVRASYREAIATAIP